MTVKGNTLSYPEHMISYFEHINIKFGISTTTTTTTSPMATTSSPFLSNSPPGIKPKPREKCCIIGCPNFKKYNHSVTKQPICSLACYKKIKI